MSLDEDRPTNLWRDAWKRLKRNRLAVAGMCIVAALVLIAVLRSMADALRFPVAKS